METFLDRLLELGATGAHLGVGHRNRRAAAFYERPGFGLIEEGEGALWYGNGMRLG